MVLCGAHADPRISFVDFALNKQVIANRQMLYRLRFFRCLYLDLRPLDVAGANCGAVPFRVPSADRSMLPRPAIALTLDIIPMPAICLLI